MLLAIWKAIEDCGTAPSANAIIACVRRHKHAFRDADAKALFRELGHRPGLGREPQIPHVGTDPAPAGPRLRAGAPADLKGLELELDSDSVDTDVSTSSSSPQKIAAQTRTKKPKQTAFVLDASEERSREILELIWPFVAATIGRSMTKSTWRSRNKKSAKDLAIVGRSDADILAAHASVSRRFGAPVYVLAKVQDELLRLGAAISPAEPETEADQLLFAEGAYEAEQERENARRSQ